ncbi:MAG: hypothetical protein AB8B73_00825 [Ekhidna sp.]
MKNLTTYLFSIALTMLFSCSAPTEKKTVKSPADYADLPAFFQEWRTFEKPPVFNDAPDYRKETFVKRRPEFDKLQERLLAMDTAGWSIAERADWMIIWAEMNGYDFNDRILKPWERDPAYYKSVWSYRSDVPAHEGPTHHMTTEIWTYEFPLDTASKEKLLGDLRVIPALNAQAKVNLTGNAKDLWIAGIRDIKTQSQVLSQTAQMEELSSEEEVLSAIQKAINSTDDLVSWLESESNNKTGSSGIGKENYTWYLQNVHLVPLTWDDEVMILKRELARAWSALKLEEHKNRKLPKMVAANSPEEYDALAEKSARSFLDFLDQDEIVSVKEYFEPALREHLGGYVPEETRNFFWITAHFDQRPLYSHFYHWFELARMDTEPHASAVRKGPLLYNIFDSRNEGTATAVEEMFMDAGMYKENPRVREIVYIMIAQRAARGLGSLYAHANEMTMEEAGKIHSEYTPRGWMKTEPELLIFEQHLYLRQPGYGTSYITGKYLLENAMMDYARMKELQNEPFLLKDFFDKLNSMGNIPMSLGHWQMTGVDTDILKIVE